MLFAVIQHLVVNLVRHHRNVGPFLKTRHELVHFGFRRHAAGRIGGRVDDNQPCLGRDQRQRLFRRKGKAVLFADRNRYWRGAGIFDHRAINGKAGIRIHDFNAGLAEHQDGHEHGRLAARHDHHFIRRNADAKALVQVGGHGFAQRQDAGSGGIAVMPVAQRLDRRFHNMFWGAEVRLADAQADDVAPLGGQGGGPRQHGKGIFLPDAVEGGDSLQHGLSPF